MAYLLIVEDSPSDRNIAEKAARAAGFSSVKSAASVDAALACLKDSLAGGRKSPAAVLLDFDIGFDAGLELLRVTAQYPKLARIPIILWTQCGEGNRRLSEEHRDIIVLSKWNGAAALRDALAELNPRPRSSARPAYHHQYLPAMLPAQ